MSLDSSTYDVVVKQLGSQYEGVWVVLDGIWSDGRFLFAGWLAAQLRLTVIALLKSVRSPSKQHCAGCNGVSPISGGS